MCAVHIVGDKRYFNPICIMDDVANDIKIITNANGVQWVECKHCKVIIVAKELFNMEYWDWHKCSRKHIKKMRELRAAAVRTDEAD